MTATTTSDRKTAALSTLQMVDTDNSFVRENVQQEIVRQVVRQKLRKQRHLVLEKAIRPEYLDKLFPRLLELFKPQTVYYNGGIAKVPEWKISCYLEVMENGVPTTEPNLELKTHFEPLLNACNDIFLYWYRQQHACNRANQKTIISCHRLMTFVTRYTPQPGEQALLKVCRFFLRVCLVERRTPWIWKGNNISLLIFPEPSRISLTAFLFFDSAARGWSWKGRRLCGSRSSY